MNAIPTNNARVKNHFNTVAAEYDYWKRRNEYYYRSLKNYFSSQIPAGKAVLELGCATGDILASVKPDRGKGVDISEQMINLARQKYPAYQFEVGNAEDLLPQGNFEYVIMCDLLDHSEDIAKVIDSASRALVPGGRIVCTTINPLWDPLMTVAEKLGLKMPEGPHTFIPNRSIEALARSKGFTIVLKGALLFIPVRIFLFSDLLNRILPSLPVLNRFCWVQCLVAEKSACARRRLSTSVVVPAYNEEGNIEECVRRIARAREDAEIVVVDDGSIDQTRAVAQRLENELPQVRVVHLPQNRGKAFAVGEGIRRAKNEAVVIFDADMSVAPEEIPLFIEPLEFGCAEFVNGSRLMYAMDPRAMPRLKRIGNFVFAMFFSALSGLRLTDTLCGTKSFFRKNFLEVDFRGERWGDFILLEHARRRSLRVMEIPVHYHCRSAGESKMRVVRDGVRFLGYMLIKVKSNSPVGPPVS